MMNASNYYYIGYKDGLENRPKRKDLTGTNKAAYMNGYKEGHQVRSLKI